MGIQFYPLKVHKLVHYILEMEPLANIHQYLYERKGQPFEDSSLMLEVGDPSIPHSS